MRLLALVVFEILKINHFVTAASQAADAAVYDSIMSSAYAGVSYNEQCKILTLFASVYSLKRVSNTDCLTDVG